MHFAKCQTELVTMTHINIIPMVKVYLVGLVITIFIGNNKPLNSRTKDKTIFKKLKLAMA